MKISAVLLAGGESRRFGQDKALFPWNGEPLWKHQFSILRGTDPAEIILSGRTDPSWRPGDIDFVADAKPSRGPIGGLAAALAVMKSSYLLALAIDMPFMTSDYLRSMIAMVTAGCGIVPILNGEPEPLAAIYPREAAETISTMIAKQSDLALRSLTRNLVRAGVMLPLEIVPNEAPLFRNINEPTDVGPDEAHAW